MQNDEYKMQNYGIGFADDFIHAEGIPKFCILHFAFCISYFSFFHSLTAISSQRLFLGLVAWPLTQW